MQNVYGDIYNFPQEQFSEVMDEKDLSKREVEQEDEEDDVERVSMEEFVADLSDLEDGTQLASSFLASSLMCLWGRI